MLGQLAAVTDECLRSTLASRIAAADDPEALWSLRQDLMAALVEVHGEMLARRRLTDITFMFAGLLDRQRHALATAGDPRDAADWPVPRGMVRNVVQLRTDH
ncbi:hypothetical protein ASF43_15340 [Pseudorhodoferax sp. Leaf267]|nr:hypothetical protein ASF43_15340 [Pseudorhodoferax sp. Leaf267]